MSAKKNRFGNPNPDKYSFQLRAAKEVVKKCNDKRFRGSILAGAVSCGKTQILIHAMNLIIKNDPNARILFLAYAQNNLKTQTLDALTNPNNPVAPCFTFGTVQENAQVTVAIPQEFYNDCDKSYSHIIIDEGHTWTHSKSVHQNIIRRLGIENIIIATGTVGSFVRYNQENIGRKYAFVFIPGEEMIKKGLYSAVDIDLVKVNHYFDTYQTLKIVFEHAERTSDDLSRPVIVCKNSKKEKIASLFLSSRGYSVGLATAKADPRGVEIEKFKRRMSDALVIVNRGLLGLNIPEATAMICLRQSYNPELVLQYMARMFRKSSNGRKKTFLRPSTQKDWNKNVVFLHRVLSLMELEVQRHFSGKMPSDKFHLKAA
jgi:superfamily II DNA or RNA helicase